MSGMDVQQQRDQRDKIADWSERSKFHLTAPLAKTAQVSELTCRRRPEQRANFFFRLKLAHVCLLTRAQLELASHLFLRLQDNQPSMPAWRWPETVQR